MASATTVTLGEVPDTIQSQGNPQNTTSQPDSKEQRKQAILDATALNASKDWTKRVERQGPWDPEKDPVSLDGVNSLPMPVQIADGEDLEPFFAHLGANGSHIAVDSANNKGVPGVESDTNPVSMLEFPKGVVYEDQRMDLCKMVVGPPHIDRLLDSLDTNTFVKHFLLGNNIIGPRGARRIARFVGEHPCQMETWYLAGNCIDGPSFHLLSQAFIQSPAITNIWLKRNPLTSAVAGDMFELITKAASLRTLDFDQTSFGDAGVAQLFERLADHDEPVSLRNLYMNGNGMSIPGATQLARYLASPHCKLESLYISVNPLGNAGVKALAAGLTKNTSLQRLSMESVGMSGTGAIALFESMKQHPTIAALNVGTAYQTGDLGGRFNYLADDAADTICELIFTSRSLRYLDLGYTALSAERYIDVLRAVAGSTSGLVHFSARPGSTNLTRPANYRKMLAGDINLRKGQVYGRLQANVRAAYGRDWTYERFQKDQQRFMMSPSDVRLIDSVYRNRDAGLARRGLKLLEKDWDEADETLKGVMET